MKAVTPVSFRQLFGDDMNANERRLVPLRGTTLSQEEGWRADTTGLRRDRRTLQRPRSPVLADDTGHTQRWTYGDLLAQSRRSSLRCWHRASAAAVASECWSATVPNGCSACWRRHRCSDGVDEHLFHPSELAYQLQHADVQLLIMERQASQDFVSDLVALCPPLAAGRDRPCRAAVSAPDSLHRRRDGVSGIRSWQSFLEDGETITSAAGGHCCGVEPVDPH